MGMTNSWHRMFCIYDKIFANHPHHSSLYFNSHRFITAVIDWIQLTKNQEEDSLMLSTSFLSCDCYVTWRNEPFDKGPVNAWMLRLIEPFRTYPYTIILSSKQRVFAIQNLKNLRIELSAIAWGSDFLLVESMNEGLELISVLAVPDRLISVSRPRSIFFIINLCFQACCWKSAITIRCWQCLWEQGP